MPSNPATPEYALNGNSGDPATSQKMTNSNATQVRGAAPGSSSKFESSVTTNEIKASASSTGQPPSAAAAAASSGESFDDTYRDSDGSHPIRELSEPTQDDKIATISVRTYGSKGGNDVIDSFASFFLQSVSESDSEKVQIVETFTAYYAFFYGKKPPIYNFSGLLLNDSRNNWTNSFKYLYDNFLRGTASAEIGAETVMVYDKKTVTGFLLNFNLNRDAMNDKGCPFSFSMLVIDDTTTEYGVDFNDYIGLLKETLANLKQQAADGIALLTQNPDGRQSQVKNSALGGLLPMSSASSSDGSMTSSAVSMLGLSPSSSSGQSSQNLKQVAVSGDAGILVKPAAVTADVASTNTSSSSSTGFVDAARSLFGLS